MTESAQPLKGETKDNRPLPRVIAEFSRERHLVDFSLRDHLLKTTIICLLLLTGSLYLALQAQPLDWLLVVVFMLCANFIEWGIHRYPMHRPMDVPPGARLLYLNHTLVHHRAFLHQTMPMCDRHELGLILMPWYTMLLVMALGLPVALVAWWLRGPGVFGIFYVVALVYYFAYEVLHALYHTDDATQRRLRLKDNRLFQFLRAHHAHHHRLDRMSRVNFNVTVPVADLILGTRERPELAADAVAAAESWDRGMNEKERRTLNDFGS